MKRVQKFIGLLLIFLSSYASNGAHIIGGDVVYECINLDTVQKKTRFRIQFTMYRDSKGGGANFDNNASFGLFRRELNSTSWAHVTTITANPTNVSDVDYSNPCIIIPPNIGVQKGTYQFEVTLDWGQAVYQIAYQRCCRNGTITNIEQPGSTGAAFVLEIYATAINTCNNSPKFRNFPPTVICINQPLAFDHSAIDAEGDQLAYEFCSPLTAGGRDGDSGQGDPSGCTGVRPNPARCSPPFEEVRFRQPTFSPSSPLAASVPVLINPETGLITGTPNATGQYVVGVCVKEFRNGQLIGLVRRDFQFNVTTCQIAVDAIIEPDQNRITDGYVTTQRIGNRFLLKSCGAPKIPFINKSIQANNIKGYKWIVNNGAKRDSFTSKDLDYTFNGIGKYKALMIVNPDLSACSDTAEIDIEINPGLKADFSTKYDTCIAGDIAFTDKSTAAVAVKNYRWIFDKDTSKVQNPSYFYRTPGIKDVRFRITDINNCENEASKKVTYLPVPALLVIEPTQFVGCEPATIKFNNLSVPIDTTYKIEWTFGDGKTSNKISPLHTYDSSGVYSVRLALTSPIGCTTSKSYGQWIEVLEKPLAKFDYTPKSLNAINKKVNFTNYSEREISIVWDFGGKGTSFAENPIYTFPDTGLYKVRLLAFHESGCTDTAFADIDIKPVSELSMPTAFTPNNDGLNDEFKGFGNLDGVPSFKMTIWSRWGEKIYETTNPLAGWTGEKDNKGLLLPQGVYVYVIDYTTSRGEEKQLKGHVTLVR
jgi:gliding motility-associated-like protein